MAKPIEPKQGTKEAKILAHLRRGWNLSNVIAYEKYGYTRLGSIIYQLRLKGYKIVSIPRESKEGDRYAEYRLQKEV